VSPISWSSLVAPFTHTLRSALVVHDVYKAATAKNAAPINPKPIPTFSAPLPVAAGEVEDDVAVPVLEVPVAELVLLAEAFVEEDEAEQLLGVGGGFDQESDGTSPESQFEDDAATRLPFTPYTARQSFFHVPPSAPASKSAFSVPRGPATAVQASFDLTPRTRTRSKNKHRPAPLSVLPPVPASPIGPPVQHVRVRTESRKPDRPPAYLRNPRLFSQHLPTPSPTLFVFPPSPTLSKQAPSTMILTPTVDSFVPFPSVPASSVPNRMLHSRRMSLIGVAPPATPTTAYSRVDARGWIGKE